MNIILWNYESVWHHIWPQSKCRSLWPIFHSSAIFPYILKTIWYMITILWDYESVWPDIWPQNMCRTLWPICHGPVILLYILKTVQWLNIILMCQYGPTSDLKIFVGHCDLYFMVQWICLISWRLFDVWTSFFEIMSQYDTTFDLEINVGHCELYFIIQWFYFISQIVFDGWMTYFWKMSKCITTFDLKINLGHSDLYFTSNDFSSSIFLLWHFFKFLFYMSHATSCVVFDCLCWGFTP